MAPTNNQVAEMQGLYGPFTLAERVVQKIWLRGDFARDRAVLTDGRSLAVRSTGAWNLLGGPDFRGARLVIGGREVSGDIEVHFHASDWRAHGHAADRAYDHVVLHVVLFPPTACERPVLGADGREIPTLVLLPLLHRDLEEYASDDALEVITARDAWGKFSELAALPSGERNRIICEHAADRWRQKRYFAGVRIEKLGWTAAVHHTALEILGYRQNRPGMLLVAAHHPFEAWTAAAGPGQAFETGRGAWQLHGVRPANQPLNRLRQYQRWVSARPDWPDRLVTIAGALAPAVNPDEPSPAARRTLGLKMLRESFGHGLMGGAVSGPRVDNLVCDGFLPLVAARTGRDLFAFWHHWFLGDTPDLVRKALPQLGLAGTRLQPFCHGRAQGLLGWIMAREARASRCGA